MKFKKKLLSMLLTLSLLFSLTGCNLGNQAIIKVRDLEFTVLDPEQVPKPLQEVIDENLADEMKLSYQNNGKLFIARGFGEQKSGGYSIAVEQCYLGEDAIHVKFQLIGPPKAENLTDEVSYPYVVIQMEDPGLQEIVFE